MIRVVLVEAHRLPAAVPGAAVHRRDGVTFLMRDDLTPYQLADWIDRLGAHIPVQAADARGRRSTPTAQ